MRYITYTNPDGSIVTLGQNDYPITSISGLGVPDVEIATQKAPYQDGATWIDNTFAEREIYIEGAINIPKDLPEMYAAKGTLMSVLNPKLGPGTLIYTDDNGSKQIPCTPQITFSNKEGTDPFLRYSLTMTCNQPYFEDLDYTEIEVDSDYRLTKTLLITSASGFSSKYTGFVEWGEWGGNGVFYLVYTEPSSTEISDSIKYRKFNGSTWESEQTIITAQVKKVLIISGKYLPNGTLIQPSRIIYILSSDDKVYEITSTSVDLTSWSSPVELVGEACSDICASFANTDSTGSENTRKGGLFYKKVADNFIYCRRSINNIVTPWESEQQVTDYQVYSIQSAYFEYLDINITPPAILFYIKSDGKMYMQIPYYDGTNPWLEENEIFIREIGVGSSRPYESKIRQAGNLSNGKIFLIYSGPGGFSDNQSWVEYDPIANRFSAPRSYYAGLYSKAPAHESLSGIIRTVYQNLTLLYYGEVDWGITEIENSGDVETGAIITSIRAVKQLVINYDNDEFIGTEYDTSSSTITVNNIILNTLVGEKSISLENSFFDWVPKINGNKYLLQGSTFLNIPVGTTKFLFAALPGVDLTSNNWSATFKFKKRYLGV